MNITSTSAYHQRHGVAEHVVESNSGRATFKSRSCSQTRTIAGTPAHVAAMDKFRDGEDDFEEAAGQDAMVLSRMMGQPPRFSGSKTSGRLVNEIRHDDNPPSATERKHCGSV